ncbi:MAG: hypothetical protein NTW74_13675, partial [Acidobacteria bacterium]|nr:hypothetical protein [Acidobacteriota bacterium]
QALDVAIDNGRVALGRAPEAVGALAKFTAQGDLVFATFTPGVLVRTAIGRTGDIYLSALKSSTKGDQTEIWKLSPQGDLLAKLSLDARVATLEVDATGRPVMCVDRKRILRLSADLSRIDTEEPLDCELVLPRPDGSYWWKSGTFPGAFGFLDSNLKLVESRDPFLNGWVALGPRSVDQEGA